MMGRLTMAFADLGEFVAHIEKHNQLHRITASVSRDLEIAEIADRVSKGPAVQNKALLFERVEGYDMPVLINAFGSAQRMAWALGVDDLSGLPARAAGLLNFTLPGPFLEELQKPGTPIELAPAWAKAGGPGPCPEP